MISQKLTTLLDFLIVVVLVICVGDNNMSFIRDFTDFFKVVGCSVVQHKPGDKAFEGSHIYNFGQVEENFWRGSEPKELSDYQGLVEHYGIKTIIDLRDSNSEESAEAKKFCESAGIKLIELPLKDTEAPTHVQEKEILVLLNRIKYPAPNFKPVFVHCRGARHRTGIFVAMYRILYCKYDLDKAYKEMKDYDFYSVFGHKDLKEYIENFYERWAKQLTNELLKKSGK